MFACRTYQEIWRVESIFGMGLSCRCQVRRDIFEKMLDSVPVTIVAARDWLFCPLHPSASDAQLVCCSWGLRTSADSVWEKQTYCQEVLPSCASTLPCVVAESEMVTLPEGSRAAPTKACLARRCAWVLVPLVASVPLVALVLGISTAELPRWFHREEPVAEAERAGRSGRSGCSGQCSVLLSRCGWKTWAEKS